MIKDPSTHNRLSFPCTLMIKIKDMIMGSSWFLVFIGYQITSFHCQYEKSRPGRKKGTATGPGTFYFAGEELAGNAI